jgi:hypothetical protein
MAINSNDLLVRARYEANLAGHALHVRMLGGDFFAFRGTEEWLDLWSSFPSVTEPAVFKRAAKFFRMILPVELQSVFDCELGKATTDYTVVRRLIRHSEVRRARQNTDRT